MHFTEKLLQLTKSPVESEDERYFRLKSSLCSQWVPCIVGNTEDRTFPVSAAVSLTMRSIALLAVVLLAAYSYPETFHDRTLLFYCQTNQTLHSLNVTAPCTNFDCLGKTENQTLSYKYRICNEENTFVFIGAAVLVTCNALSIISIIWLHHLSKYINLHKVSTYWPTCFPFKPIAHRSMVMELIERGNDKKLEEVLEKTPEAGARQDSEGNSPINFAIRVGGGLI